MEQKPKLTVREQIEYMAVKGVKFNIVSKEEAEQYLKRNTYFFKIKFYAKNYEKYRTGANKGKYINLEFAYLQELSVLDFHIRRNVMSLCVNIEHMIKVLLNSIISEMPEEDGYGIVDDFKQENEYIVKKIQDASSHYTDDLKRNGTFASWNIVEFLSFNDLKRFFEFCFKRWNANYSKNYSLDAELCKNISQLLYAVRHLRNAAAHNNCLLHLLNTNENFSANKILAAVISKYMTISDNQKKKKLKSYFLHDFTAMLILFKLLNSSEGVLKHTKSDFEDLMARINKNKNYFDGNSLICSSFAYLQKVIDIL